MYILSRYGAVKFIIPPLLACILFAATLFAFVLPVSKSNLLEQKKEAIAVLTQTASTILSYYHALAQSGTLTEEEAKKMAIVQLRSVRYGQDKKDYFWINDLQPTMIMHPYRPDLEGQDLTTYTDLNNKHLFVEFVNTVTNQGSGYVPYLWQWKDIPEQIVSKLSYVSLFEPWGWIIGTGVYLDDVHTEFAQTSKQLMIISLIILSMIILLSLFIGRQGVRENSKRRAAEQQLQHQNEQLEEIVAERTSELKEALSQVKLLSGFLPICASCKKIRDDKGYWEQVEVYVQRHSHGDFSHGICPECTQEHFPDL